MLAQQRLGGGRIHHAMRWLGQAQRSLDIMCERAVSRTSHGKLLAQHQMVQDYVALSHMEIQSARLLTFQTAWKMDKYGAAAVRADLGMIKAHVSKVVLGGTRPHDPGVRRARLLERPARRVVVPLDAVRPDRRRPRRAAQVGARPHAVEGLHTRRWVADRAHPEPTAGGRGEVG